jgi:hypothetical protein
MSRTVSTLLVLQCFLLLTTGHAGEERRISRLAWLEGRWQIERPRLVTMEEWLPAVGSTMLGIGRVVKSDSLVSYEVVIIRERGARFAYEAHPSRQEPTTFLSTVVTDSMVVFENLAHDFPQRIGYQRIGADSLYAWIEGPVRGTTKRNEFPYRRFTPTP